MSLRAKRASGALAVCVASMVAGHLVGACSNESAGDEGEAGLYTSDGGATLGCTKTDTITDGKGHSLMPFCAPSDPGPNGIYVSASGETLSLVGFPYPPAQPPNDTFMVDGWNFQLTAYITVFTAITIWSDPNVQIGNQSLHGPQIAQLNGPFVVDLHKGGVLPGQGGAGEEATPIGVFSSDTLGTSCATTSCGFGFSTVAAPTDYGAYNVNLDPTENAYYAYMVQGGYSVLYVGTATWLGNQAWTYTGDCPMPSPECATTSVTPPYDFSADGGFPQTMSFMLGFSTPTNYVNCQNGSEFPGQPGIGNEEYPRGIQTNPSRSEPAQVTIHMDHPFWESFAENSPLHWDQIAAQYVGKQAPIAHTEDMKSVDFTAFTDSKGKPLSVRNCGGSCYTPMPGSQLHFDPLDVSVCPGADTPSECLGSYYDFIRYSQSTQGHLNSQGFCFIDRQYPAPSATSP